jgi:alpha-maltose-1-phosphate synthase
MKISIATMNQAHQLLLARSLQERNFLETLYCCLPPSFLAKKGLDLHHCRTDYLAGALNYLQRFGSTSFRSWQEPWHKIVFDWRLSRTPFDSDVLLTISSVATLAGKAAKRQGALWVVDRPCAHISLQDSLLREEFEINGQKWSGISKWIVDRELEEYESADRILVGSQVAKKSFLDRGVAEDRLWTLHFPIDLSRFYPEGEPDPGIFTVLYVGQKSFRKGMRYLIEAFRLLDVERKQLLLVGSSTDQTRALVHASAEFGVVDVDSVAHDELRGIMSKSHVLVLPSIEDGFGMVVPQAMACGCPVIVSENAGAADVVEEGVNGYVTPVRDSEALAEKLQLIASDGELRSNLSRNARASALKAAGLDSYCDSFLSLCLAARSTNLPLEQTG